MNLEGRTRRRAGMWGAYTARPNLLLRLLITSPDVNQWIARMIKGDGGDG